MSRQILTPYDAGFESAASKWGPPAAADVLVRPSSVAELADALRWAVRSDVPVGVRSGGHGAWAQLAGGMLVDLAEFDAVEVLADDHVRVGAGATWGRVAETLASHGLAISAGDTRSVGVGGLTLGAGVGWMVRIVGLAVDQLVRAEVVTAGGDTVVASATENPDLFFAIRGGGGNFGVVTTFEFRATRLSDVVFATAPIDPARLPAVIKDVADVLAGAPRGLDVIIVRLPPFGPAAKVPPMIKMMWAGDDVEGARAAFAPLLDVPGIGAPELNVVPYASVLVDPPPIPPGPAPRVVEHAPIFTALTDETVEAVAAALAAHPASVLDVRYLGGALADTPADATALAWRGAQVMIHWAAIVLPGAAGVSEDDVARAREVWSAVDRHSDGLYGSFTEDDGARTSALMYPPETLTRLRAAKRKWDPDNVFRRNHNIAAD